MTWITDTITTASPLASPSDETSLIEALLESVYNYDLSQNTFPTHRGQLLAAAFDLLVTAEYYRTTSRLHWVYCPNVATEPMAYYPYTSVCPHCVINGKFHFYQANKPSSGNIGATTSRLLAIFIKALFEKHQRKIAVLKGREPVDIIFWDKTTNPHVFLFAEVKAAPLVTLPLVISTEQLTFEENQVTIALQTHKEIALMNLSKTNMSILIPIESPNTPLGWGSKNFSIGYKENEKDGAWAYRGLANLVQHDPSFFRDYSKFWLMAFNAYSASNKTQPIFWLTNACGQPSPRPDDWPQRAHGGGYESISDRKTSVGMDRTDDIKKSIYQVLKLGVEGKPSQNGKFLVGVISNIHAVRHFGEYLATLTDIVWTRAETSNIEEASQLPPNTVFFNLFDGIVTFTQLSARDSWIKSTFNF